MTCEGSELSGPKGHVEERTGILSESSVRQPSLTSHVYVMTYTISNAINKADLRHIEELNFKFTSGRNQCI